MLDIAQNPPKVRPELVEVNLRNTLWRNQIDAIVWNKSKDFVITLSQHLMYAHRPIPLGRTKVEYKRHDWHDTVTSTEPRYKLVLLEALVVLLTMSLAFGIDLLVILERII